MPFKWSSMDGYNHWTNPYHLILCHCMPTYNIPSNRAAYYPMASVVTIVPFILSHSIFAAVLPILHFFSIFFRFMTHPMQSRHIPFRPNPFHIMNSYHLFPFINSHCVLSNKPTHLTSIPFRPIPFFHHPNALHTIRSHTFNYFFTPS